MKSVDFSPLAEADAASALEYYFEEAPHMVGAFRNELARAVGFIAENPGAGSPRYSIIPGLRFWTLNRFPYAVFYIELDAGIDVIRVLHQRADSPARLQGGAT